MNIPLVPKILPRSEAERRAALERSLMRHEAQIGGQLFGPVPKGHKRDFFCLDEYTWIWHEEWLDQTGRRRAVTTRYDVRPGGVIKSQDGAASHQPISKDEARNLYQAVQLYQQRVNAEYQRML